MYNQRSYNNYNGNRSYQRNNSQQGKKKSGARMFSISKGSLSGKFGVSAWNVSRKRGFMTLTAFPMTSNQLKAWAKNRNWSDSKPITQSKRGITYERWIGQCQNKTTGEFCQTVCYYDRGTNKLYVPRFGMVASINKNYFGSSRRPKN